VAGDGFTVVMADLQRAAGAFDAQAGRLRGLIPAGGPPCPDGGSGEIDGALHSVLSGMGSLTASLAGALAVHGRKLAQAHANYAHAEITSTQLCNDLATALGAAQPSGGISRRWTR
jgi:Family of unknown function (DUF6317)